MNKRTVWGLTAGNYSDYRVLALFTTREAAVTAEEAHNADVGQWGEQGAIAEFDLYDELPEKDTVWRIEERIAEDGTTSGYSETSEARLPWNHGYFMPTRVQSEYYDHIRPARLRVWGTDQQAVRQAFSDRKAQIRAEQQGLA